MFKDEPIGEEVLEITEAVFHLVHIEPEMPRNVQRDELASFNAPTLVIAAENDGLFPAEAVVRRAHRVFPNLVSAEVIPGATHYMSTRHQVFLCERIERFLRESC
jgi:pimeloyl-ACP methyl ester carboxylesterase